MTISEQITLAAIFFWEDFCLNETYRVSTSSPWDSLYCLVFFFKTRNFLLYSSTSSKSNLLVQLLKSLCQESLLCKLVIWFILKLLMTWWNLLTAMKDKLREVNLVILIVNRLQSIVYSHIQILKLGEICYL